MTTLTLSKEKSISDIKTLEFLTKEEIILNKENRKTEYNIKFQIPDKIKKEIYEIPGEGKRIGVMDFGIKRKFLFIHVEV